MVALLIVGAILFELWWRARPRRLPEPDDDAFERWLERQERDGGWYPCHGCGCPLDDTDTQARLHHADRQDTILCIRCYQERRARP